MEVIVTYVRWHSSAIVWQNIPPHPILIKSTVFLAAGQATFTQTQSHTRDNDTIHVTNNWYSTIYNKLHCVCHNLFPASATADIVKILIGQFRYFLFEK